VPEATRGSRYGRAQANAHEICNTFGSVGVYSTPSDLCRLGAMLMHWGQREGRTFLSRAAVAEMATSFDPLPTAATNHGLG
jgi:CubicO group peptidase (beta-lactamase class C family)